MKSEPDECSIDDALAEALPDLLHLTTALEGHADNVAASLYGGVVATAGGRAVRVPMSFDPAMVMWVPPYVTSTDESRTSLPSSVPLADVVFNLGRTALLVAALAAGDVDSLREATRDRLHQDIRLVAAPPSRAALDAALAAGAWAAWLSGSGPTVAAMCAVDEAEDLAAAMPADADAAGTATKARPYKKNAVGVAAGALSLGAGFALGSALGHDGHGGRDGGQSADAGRDGDRDGDHGMRGDGDHDGRVTTLMDGPGAVNATVYSAFLRLNDNLVTRRCECARACVLVCCCCW